MEWQPLSQKLVAEVQFDHFTADGFATAQNSWRWRPEKIPSNATMNRFSEDRSGAGLTLRRSPIAGDHSRKLGGLGAVALPRPSDT